MHSRKIHRRKSFKIVRFIQTSGGDGINCTMTDMHSEGARLLFEGLIPDFDRTVEIMIVSEQVPVKATVAWSGLNEMGITFSKPLKYLQGSDNPAMPRTALPA